MKKTLTVNLGGTVFHIDEDAYRLLDNYLCNLKLHFRKQEGAEEIVDDIEARISELFLEKLNAGSQVITLADVEDRLLPSGGGTSETRRSHSENRRILGLQMKRKRGLRPVLLPPLLLIRPVAVYIAIRMIRYWEESWVVWRHI